MSKIQVSAKEIKEPRVDETVYSGTHRFFQTLLWNPAAFVYGLTDYLYLGTPYLLDLRENERSLTHDFGPLGTVDHEPWSHGVVVAENVIMVAARLLDAALAARGINVPGLQKWPMRVLAGAHLFGLAPTYYVAGDYRSLAFTITLGIGNEAVIGDVKKLTDWIRQQVQSDIVFLKKCGQRVKAYADNAMTWFAGGLVCAATYPLESGSYFLTGAMAVPLTVGAVFAERNSRNSVDGLPANEGMPNLCYSATMTFAGIGAIVLMGGEEYVEGLKQAAENIAGISPIEDKEGVYSSLTATAAFGVAAGYAMLENTFNPDSYRKIRAAFAEQMRALAEPLLARELLEHDTPFDPPPP